MGKGVEHTMLARLGEIAQQRGLSCVALQWIRSKKPEPAFDFIESLAEGVKERLDNGFLLRIAADRAASVTYDPEAGSGQYELPAKRISLRPRSKPYLQTFA